MSSMNDQDIDTVEDLFEQFKDEFDTDEILDIDEGEKIIVTNRPIGQGIQSQLAEDEYLSDVIWETKEEGYSIDRTEHDSLPGFDVTPWEEYVEENDVNMDFSEEIPEDNYDETLDFNNNSDLVDGTNENITPKYSPLRFDPDQNIDIDFVSRTNPKSTGAKIYWGSLIDEFQQTVPVELILGTIPDPSHPWQAQTIRIEQSVKEDVLDRLGGGGIFATRISPMDSIYSTVTQPPNTIDIGHGDFETFIVSSDKDILEEVNQILLSDDESEYDRVSEIYGIPQCCSNGLTTNSTEGDTDRVYEAACNTESAVAMDERHQEIEITSPNPLLNVFWRSVGIQFISHIPHSFDCMESQEIAKKNYTTLVNRGYQDLADMALAWLDLEQSWSGYSSLAHVKNPFWVHVYTTDDYWDEKKVIWNGAHSPAPEGEHGYHTRKNAATSGNVSVPGKL